MVAESDLANRFSPPSTLDTLSYLGHLLRASSTHGCSPARLLLRQGSVVAPTAYLRSPPRPPVTVLRRGSWRHDLGPFGRRSTQAPAAARLSSRTSSPGIRRC